MFIFASMNLFCPKKILRFWLARARIQCKCMNRSDTLTHRWIQNNASRFNRVARKGNLQQPKSWSPIHATAIICNQMNENWIWIQTKWKSWMWISINWSKWVNVYEYACGWTFNMRMCTVHSDQRRHIHRVWIKNFPFNPLHSRHYYYRRRCRHFFDYMLVLHIWMDHLMHWNFNWTFNLIKRYETTSLHLNFSWVLFFFVRSFILSSIDCISGLRCFIKTRIPCNQKANGNFDWLTDSLNEIENDKKPQKNSIWIYRYPSRVANKYKMRWHSNQTFWHEHLV